MDFAQAQYFSNVQGRFINADPLMASANIGKPQSWNRYSYVQNNPLMFTDPLGLYPSPAFNCANGSNACLNDEQRRILNDSKIKIGDKTYSGEALYTQLNEKQQNAFVNQTDRLGSIKVEGGGTALGMVKSLTVNPETGKVADDRIFAVVDPKLATSIAKNKDFKEADIIKDQHPGADISYKSKDKEGNIQFTFNKERTIADIDHDLCTGLCHLMEAAKNHATNSTTDQNEVRKLLVKMPGVGITPSSDTKYNRK